MGNLGLVLGALGVILLSSLWRAFVNLIWRPYSITKIFKKQGVTGPGCKFRSGSLDEIKKLKTAAMATELDIHSHDIIPRVLPYYSEWMNQYGGIFLYWFGSTRPRVCIADAELAKQVLSNKFGFYEKLKARGLMLTLLGRGLVSIEGLEWTRHRRVVGPAFVMDKLKMMTKQMTECTRFMLDNWHLQIVQADGQQRKAIEVNRQFQELTADVISHSAFGSSYIEGKEVFLAQRELQKLIFATFFNTPFPGSNYIPTKTNIKRWKLDRQLRKTVTSMIRSRLKSEGSNYGNDLLGLMIEYTQKQGGMGMTMSEMIDECKTFFFAGHETTSHLLTWTMFLLSTNPEWQEKLREEVVRECGREIPSADILSKLKLVTMVLQEALRLYSPVLRIFRVALKDMKLGDIMIPRGTEVSIPLIIIHRNKEYWGDDANEFNPLRFQNGITKAAKHPNAMLGFSMGPRACIGQDFAMLEAKTVIAMILQRFSFSLSPEYKHKPADLLTLQPQDGLPIILKPLIS